jgi:hypothetical protein
MTNRATADAELADEARFGGQPAAVRMLAALDGGRD